MQVFGCVIHMLSQMMQVIGPYTYLWVFVKGVTGKACGPFFPEVAPGMNLIGNALKEFPAQV